MFKLQTPEIKGLLQQADSGNTSDRLRCGLWTHHATLHSYVIQTQQSRTDINRLWTAQRTGDAITICSLNIYNKCSSSFSLCVTAQCAKQRSCSLTFRKTHLQDEDRKVFPVLFHDSETASNDISEVGPGCLTHEVFEACPEFWFLPTGEVVGVWCLVAQAAVWVEPLVAESGQCWFLFRIF